MAISCGAILHRDAIRGGHVFERSELNRNLGRAGIAMPSAMRRATPLRANVSERGRCVLHMHERNTPMSRDEDGGGL